MSESDFSLHREVWEGSLSLASITPETDLEVRDPHGRTALMLAVMLGRADSAKILVDAGHKVPGSQVPHLSQVQLSQRLPLGPGLQPQQPCGLRPEGPIGRVQLHSHDSR